MVTHQLQVRCRQGNGKVRRSETVVLPLSYTTNLHWVKVRDIYRPPERIGVVRIIFVKYTMSVRHMSSWASDSVVLPAAYSISITALKPCSTKWHCHLVTGLRAVILILYAAGKATVSDAQLLMCRTLMVYDMYYLVVW